MTQKEYKKLLKKESPCLYRYRAGIYLLFAPFRWIRRKLWTHCQSRYLELEREAILRLFSSIGVDKLRGIVERAEMNREKYGHHNYTDLADFYFKQIYD